MVVLVVFLITGRQLITGLLTQSKKFGRNNDYNAKWFHLSLKE